MMTINDLLLDLWDNDAHVRAWRRRQWNLAVDTVIERYVRGHWHG